MSATPTAVRFPPGVIDEITAAAAVVGMSRNAWIVSACQHRLDLANVATAHRADEPTEAPVPVPAAKRLSFDIECRQVVGRWHWRVVGSEEIGGTVYYRRDVTAAARQALTEAHGVPVDVHLT